MPKICTNCKASFDGRRTNCPECVRIKDKIDEEAEEEVLFELSTSLRELKDEERVAEIERRRIVTAKQEAVKKAAREKMAAEATEAARKLEEELAAKKAQATAAIAAAEVATKAAETAMADAKIKMAEAEAAKKEALALQEAARAGVPPDSTSGMQGLLDKLQITMNKMDEFVSTVTSRAGTQNGAAGAPAGQIKFNFNNPPPGLDPATGDNAGQNPPRQDYSNGGWLYVGDGSGTTGYRGRPGGHQYRPQRPSYGLHGHQSWDPTQARPPYQQQQQYSPHEHGGSQQHTGHHVHDEPTGGHGCCQQNDSELKAQEQLSAEVSTLANTSQLADDLKVLMSCPDMCDVVFLVGEDRVPVHGVKAILSARSKVFQKLLQTHATVPKKPHRKLSDVKPPNMKTGLGNLRLFNRRASDTGHLSGDVPVPLLNSAISTSPLTQIVVEEFDEQVYQKLMLYLHTGTVTFEPKSLIGLINAAEHYGLEELAQGCTNYMRHCVSILTVCDLLLSAEKYIQYKTTKVYIQKVMDFIDKNAESVLIQQELTELPCHVLSLVLSREDVHASASTKFNAALAWSRAQLRRKNPENKDLKEIFSPFLDVIEFNLIPATTLMKEVKPLGLVPDPILMAALAYQADPDSVPPPNPGSRRPSGRGCTDEESIGSTSDLQEEINKLSVKSAM